MPNELLKLTTEAARNSRNDEDHRYDVAENLAVALLVKAGYDHEDLDEAGVAVHDEAEALLIEAFLRCPSLVDVIEPVASQPTGV